MLQGGQGLCNLRRKTTHAEKQILLLENQRFPVVTEAFGADGEVAACAVVEKFNLGAAVFIEHHIGIPVERAAIVAGQVLHRHARVVGMHEFLAVAVALNFGTALAHHQRRLNHFSAIGREKERHAIGMHVAVAIIG